jgi:hypothetical protein
MNKLITTTARKTLSGSFAAMLAVAAMTTLTAGATPAKAWDQQATGAEMDSELSHTATGDYAYAPRHRSGPYARAYAPAHTYSDGVGGSQRDFQLEGR